MTQQRMWGADSDALDTLARDMQNASDRLDSISRQLTARLMSSAWDGGDADRFRAEWNQKYRGQLRSSVQFLRQSQVHLSSSGAQQRAASAADSTTAAAGLSAIAATQTPGLGSARGAYSRGADDDAFMNFFSEVFPLAAEMADLMDVFPGGLGTTLGGATSAFGFFSGWMDLVYEQKHEGNFGYLEIGGDSLAMLGGGLGVLALLPTPASPVLLVAGMAVSGLGMGINMALDGWDGGGREAVSAVGTWASPRVEAAAREIDLAWDSAYEAGLDQSAAIVSGMGKGLHRATDEAQEQAGVVWDKATGWLPW